MIVIKTEMNQFLYLIYIYEHNILSHLFLVILYNSPSLIINYILINPGLYHQSMSYSTALDW